MKKAYINCEIYQNEATAILTEDERIVLVSDNDSVLSQTDDSDEIIDLNHMFVLPGFVDSHLHLMELGYYLEHVVLENCHSLEEVKTKIEQRLPRLKEGEWLIGRGYNEDAFEVVQKPDRLLLDEISMDVPIVLTRACGHVMSVNLKALQMAGITPETTVEGGVIDYERGILEENALHIMHDALPKPDVMEIEDYILRGASQVNRVGITTVGSDDFISIMKDYRPTLDAFEKLSFQQRLNVRVNEQCEFQDTKDFSQFLDDGYTFDVGNDFFKIGPLKLIIDGSLGARTAALSQPYADDPKTSGYLSMSEDEIETYVALASRFNMPTITHCIGDAAVDAVLNVYDEYVYEGNPLHHGLVHCQIMRPDQIQRVIDHQYSCYYQSAFIDYDASILEQRVGAELAKTSYPYKTLYENTLCSNGSDAPVEMPNPLLGIQLAVTRESTRYPGACMNEQECLSVEQAIDSFTINGAKQLFMDDCIGKIQTGYYADFVVIDQNLTKMDPHEIASAKVMMTIMNGKTVFEK